MKKGLGPGTIVFPTPVYIVATYGKDGTPSAMNVAWGGIYSQKADPIAFDPAASQ